MAGQTAVAKASDAQRTSCERCPLRKLEVFRQFTPKEFEFISSFKVGEFRAEAGTALLLAGNNSAHLYTMLSGWAFRSKELSDGRRQILNFAFPGDFIGLQSAVLDAMEHSVVALTDVVLCVFEREKLWRLFESHPGLGFDMTWLAAREERMLDEHLLSIGRRTALERTAYFLLHVYRRAKEPYPCPREPRRSLPSSLPSSFLLALSPFFLLSFCPLLLCFPPLSFSLLFPFLFRRSQGSRAGAFHHPPARGRP